MISYQKNIPFNSLIIIPPAEDEEDWPPFRKIGHFDPYTDDPRLGIQRIFLCPVSDILVVAGTAGQVVVLQMEREQREADLKVSEDSCSCSHSSALIIIVHVV